MVSLVDQLEKIMIEANEARKTHESRLLSLNANYDSTEADFKAAFLEFNEKKNNRQKRVLAIDQRARTQTTEREWRAISKKVAHALEAAAKAELGM